MQGSEIFKQTISRYLDEKSESDPQFAQKRLEVNRSIDDIVTYILNQVKDSGCNGLNNEEIYGMAVHAAEETDLIIGNPIQHGLIVVNHRVELTEEEKAEQRKLALKRFQDEEYRKFEQRNQKKTSMKTNNIDQPSLFDF